MWSSQNIATAICAICTFLIICLSLLYVIKHILSLLASRRMQACEDAREVAVSAADRGNVRGFTREGSEIELQNAEDLVATGNGAAQRIEIVGVAIENRVRPRERLPKGIVIVPHEDEEVYIDFRKLPEIPEAEPPPPTEEEMRRMMEEKSRVASPEFYGRSEYIERHSSARNTPQHLYSNSFSIKQGNHKGGTGLYAGSVSSSCSLQSYYEPTAPYAVSLHNFLEHYRHRQPSDNLFLGSFRERGAQPGSSANNSQNVVYPAMESTSDEFEDSGSDRAGSVRREVCAATSEPDPALPWQRIRRELQPNNHAEPAGDVPHRIRAGPYALPASPAMPEGGAPTTTPRAGSPASGEGAGRVSPAPPPTRGVREKPPGPSGEPYAAARAPSLEAILALRAHSNGRVSST